MVTLCREPVARASRRCDSVVPHRSMRQGSTLVDVLVATVILGGALTALLSISGQSIAAQQRGEEIRTAAMLLDEQLNTVLMLGPDSFASRQRVEGSCDPPFENYTYRLEFSGGQSGDAYHVVATISWFSGGRVRSETIETMIAPRLGDDPDPDRRPEQVVPREFQ